MYCLVKFCRLCLAFKRDLNNMCNDNIIEKTTACIGDLEFDYNLPSLICNDCLEMLDLCFNFRNRCLQSEFLLNCFIEKLSQSKFTKEFKSTDLRVNIVNNIGVSPIKNYNKDKKVKIDDLQTNTSTFVKPVDTPVSINKPKHSCNVDEADDIFLEEEDDDENQSKFTFKRKLSTVEQSRKKLNCAVIESSDYVDSNNPCNLFTDITERVKLRKRQVQLNRKTISAVASTETSKNFRKSSNMFTNCTSTEKKHKQKVKPTSICLEKECESPNKSERTKLCNYSYDRATLNSESKIPSTDLQNDRTLHHIGVCKVDTSASSHNKSSEEKNSCLVAPKPKKPKIQVRTLESLKSSTETVTKSNDLYKANFSNILQLNGLDSANVAPSINKETERPFKILFDNIGHTQPQVKIQYVPVLKPVKSKMFLSYLNNKGIQSNDSRSLLKSNQQTSKGRYQVLSTSNNESTKKLSTNTFQTITNEHNYSTGNNGLQTTNNTNDNNVSKNNINSNKDSRSIIMTSPTSVNLARNVNLKDKIRKTWAKYIVLNKTSNMNLKDTDLISKKKQIPIILKSTKYAKNSKEPEQDLTSKKAQKPIILKSTKHAKNSKEPEQVFLRRRQKMYFLQNCCRLCLSFKRDLSNMFDEDIIEKAAACIGDLKFDYKIPNLICNDCLIMLDLFFKFRNRCQRSEYILTSNIKKLSHSKCTKKFKSTDLRVNIVKSLGVLPVMNDNKDQVRLCTSTSVQQALARLNKSKQSFNLDGANDIFLEKEHKEGNQSRFNCTQKLSVTEETGKNLKLVTVPSSDCENSNNLKEMRRNVLDLIITRQLKLIDKRPLNVVLKSQSSINVDKVCESPNEMKTTTKSCIYAYDPPTPNSKSEITTNTDLENDIPFHCIGTGKFTDNESSHDESSEGKTSSTVAPESENQKIQVHTLKNLKSSTESVTENNDHKVNFANINQLNCLDSTSTEQSVNKERKRPFDVLVDNVDYIYNKSIRPDYSGTLRKSNQQPSKQRYQVISTAISNEPPKKLSKNTFQTIKDEYNYNTEGNGSNTNLNDNVWKNNMNSNRDALNKTWAKYIMLEKMSNVNVKDTDLPIKKTQQQSVLSSVVKSTEHAKNSTESMQVFLRRRQKMYFLQNCCRLCLSFKRDLSNMFDEDILEKVAACIGDLKFDYKIPNLICNDCLIMLDLFFNFRNRCRRSEYILTSNIKKLSHSKCTKKFKSTDLRVNIVKSLAVLPVINDNKDQVRLSTNDVQITTLTLVKQALASLNKLNQGFRLDEANDIFLEKEHKEGNQSKFNCTQKLSVTEETGKNLKLVTVPSSDEEMRRNVLDLIITRQLELIDKRPLNVVLKSQSSINVDKVCESPNEMKTTTKSCIYAYDPPTPNSKSEITTNTDLENDIPFHCIGTAKFTDNESSHDKSSEGKTSSTVTPESENSKIPVRTLENLKSSTESVTENNDHKVIFANIHQLNCLDSTSTEQSVNKERKRPFDVLVDNVDYPKPQLKIIQPDKSKTLFSYLNNKRIRPDYSGTLRTSNQQPSKRRYLVISTAIINEPPKKLNKNTFQTIKNEYNYNTEDNGSNINLNDNGWKNNINSNRDELNKTKDTETNNFSSRAINLTDESIQISITLKNWFKGKCANNDRWQYFKSKWQEMTFETKVDARSALHCVIMCFCKNRCKILKSAKKPNLTPRWVYGNIHKHLNTHLNQHLISYPRHNQRFMCKTVENNLDKVETPTRETIPLLNSKPKWQRLRRIYTSSRTSKRKNETTAPETPPLKNITKQKKSKKYKYLPIKKTLSSVVKSTEHAKNSTESIQGALIVPKQETIIPDFPDDNFKSNSKNLFETIIKEENCDVSNFFINN